jgi:hypothetical protein
MRFLFALALLLVSNTPAQAGCPAAPVETVALTIQQCRFFDAANEPDFTADVDKYFTPGWDGKTAAEIEERKAAVYTNNTGAIITGLTSEEGAAAQDYFLRTADKNICTTLDPARPHVFDSQRTCRMVFFAAPAPIILTPRPE